MWCDLWVFCFCFFFVIDLCLEGLGVLWVMYGVGYSEGGWNCWDFYIWGLVWKFVDEVFVLMDVLYIVVFVDWWNNLIIGWLILVFFLICVEVIFFYLNWGSFFWNL